MLESGRRRGAALSRWIEGTLSRRGVALLIAVLLCAVGFAARLRGAQQDLSSPLIDEHEVVEQAAAFMGHDLRYHFLRYGPFTMYVLAGIYHVLAAARGMTSLEYASRVFFEGEEHYFVARAYVAWTLSVLALLSFLSFRRHYGAAPALLTCTLLAFPFVDVLTRGARIDMPQAAFQGMALLSLFEVVVRPRRRHWLAAGACAGLGIATKPLPGLLVLPCFVLASWFAAKSGEQAAARPWLARIGRTLVNPGAWLAAFACAGFAAAANPSLLRFGEFMQSQLDTVSLHSGDVSFSHQSISASASGLGLPFLVGFGLAALGCALTKDPRAVLTLAFLVIYLGAFAGRASRAYYLVAAAVAACFVVGQGFAAALRWSARVRGVSWARWAWAPLAALFVATPFQSVWARSDLTPDATLARTWIHEHVPPGTRMFYVGWRNFGPQLVASKKKVQASWGGHFLYGRRRYAFLRQAFDLAYTRYVESGRPRYAIASNTAKPLPRRARGGPPRSITDSLLRDARAKRRRYIILAGLRGDVRQLGYRWFDDAILERQFGGTAIFRVPEAPRPAGPTAPAHVQP